MLKDADGKEWTTNEDIAKCITKFYGELFSSTRLNWISIDHILEFVEPKVDKEINSYLARAFSEEEIRKAAFDLNLSKAPGMDEFPARFYHTLWDQIDEDIYKEAKAVLNEDHPSDK